jgi:GR25 family glycosyltransferase involved in LPS biosynthesis
MLPAFYINLASRPDRREHMQSELARAGIAAERVEAVTPADLPPALLAEVTGRDHRRLAATELACSFSHRRIWQLMLKRRINMALILEDDALLSTTLSAALADQAFLAAGFDAIQLETHPSRAVLGRRLPSRLPGIGRHPLMSSSLGTAGYVITAPWARQLLEDPALNLFPVDKVMFGREAGNLHRARLWQAVPALVIPVPEAAPSGVGRSDLAEARGQNSRSGKHRSGRWRHLGHDWRIFRKYALTSAIWGARQLRIPPAPDLAARL